LEGLRKLSFVPAGTSFGVFTVNSSFEKLGYFQMMISWFPVGRSERGPKMPE